jgi:hypothetical protein
LGNGKEEWKMSDSVQRQLNNKAVPKTSTAVFQLALLCIIGVGLLVYGVLRVVESGFSNWGNAVMSLIGLLLLAFAVPAFKSLRQARELDTSGDFVQGVVSGKHSKTDSDGDRTRFIVYQFGEGYGAVQKVSSSVYRQLQVGDGVQVCFLPRDPNVSRMET